MHVNSRSQVKRTFKLDAFVAVGVLRTTSMNQKFPYILRISGKAKHVRFQVSVEKGLEVVVPKRFRVSRVPSLVEKNSQWIERAFQKTKAFERI